MTVPLLRLPAVQLDSAAGRVRVQFRDAHARLGCSPAIWIDGELFATPVAALGGRLPVTRVRAVEGYPWPRSVPPPFRIGRARTTCGAPLIWTD